jgi:hypothetical protein
MDFDAMTYSRDGQLVYAMDGTPVWQPAEGSRFEVWDERRAEWVESDMLAAIAVRKFRYVEPATSR